MESATFLVFALILSITRADIDTVSYNDFQLWKAYANGSKDDKMMENLQDLGRFAMWRKSNSGPGTDILVNPGQAERLKGEFKESNIKFEVSIKNLQTLIDQTATKEEQTTDDAKKGSDMDWKAYHRLSTIYAYLNELAQKHPAICSLQSIGQTAENRQILLLRISSGVPSKRIWLDGGMHAHEWISPSAVTYIIDRIILQYAHDEPNPVKNIDWYIVPVLNPDGYEYSHTSDRLWRKNRSRVKASGTKNRCYGVDLNRNFGYQWDLEMSSSNDPCSAVYRGPAAFSEAETAAVARFFINNPGDNKSKWRGFFSMHSYGQEIVYPWASRDLRGGEMDDEVHATAYKAAQAVENRTKGRYKAGSMGDLIFGASGTSTDWARGSVLIRHSFIIELRDQGKFAYMLPHTMINIAVTEAYIIVESLVQSILAEV